LEETIASIFDAEDPYLEYYSTLDRSSGTYLQRRCHKPKCHKMNTIALRIKFTSYVIMTVNLFWN